MCDRCALLCRQGQRQDASLDRSARRTSMRCHFWSWMRAVSIQRTEEQQSGISEALWLHRVSRGSARFGKTSRYWISNLQRWISPHCTRSVRRVPKQQACKLSGPQHRKPVARPKRSRASIDQQKSGFSYKSTFGIIGRTPPTVLLVLVIQQAVSWLLAPSVDDQGETKRKDEDEWPPDLAARF